MELSHGANVTSYGQHAVELHVHVIRLNNYALKQHFATLDFVLHHSRLKKVVQHWQHSSQASRAVEKKMTW